MSVREFEARPPATGVAATVAAGAFAIAGTGLLGPAAALALAGVALMGVGVWLGSRRLHGVGALATFAGVLLAALAGVHPLAALVGAAGALLAWDAGEHALGLGEQVGRAADDRAVLLHVGASAAVALAVVVGSYGVFLFARRGQAGPAAVLLGGAVAVLALVLDW